MRPWTGPAVPALPVRAPELSLYDTATRAVRPTEGSSLYVCGITPYDATHLGHANTYISFDLIVRAWLNAGHEVTYAQNVTDVDDPLLERAIKVGADWTELAQRETALYRLDMEALRVIAPTSFIGAVESIPNVLDMIARLEAFGATYQVDGDVYFSVAADEAFGSESGLGREEMLKLFGERGGDPDRAGKRDPLDPLLWRAHVPGEPGWDSPYGLGRPGWHIECAAIAETYLGESFSVQGGGADLVFPHHEMSASHAHVVGDGFASHYAHAGLVAYDGEKMSKSRGNLVFINSLRNSEIDPSAIRLALMRHHYRDDWEWFDNDLWDAVDTIQQWRHAASHPASAPSAPVVTAVLAAMADDLNAPAAVAAIQDWVEATLHGDMSEPGAGEAIKLVADAALGLVL
ncbi:MAG TPA: cysteine--1-D-myo-inosityl 2-amino-2-deoxy-alpha-D-glucopyranoside ligase [Nocardioides sp.]|nr:cysteine--1-D-myo-inosityl 2-amino-2-deoxy-alpha-D-glucopyranoside ligase [Nocardioides sp.]